MDHDILILMSVKFQITLPDDLAAALKQAAAREGQPLAQLIRETMVSRLKERRKTGRKNPFAGITGIANSDETDLAARVDQILYR